MASRRMKRSSSSLRRRDRISGLADEILGHILSFLPTKEAGRAAVLGRRWRDVFASVHTISFEEEEGEREDDWYTFYVEAEEMKSCSAELLDTVNAALLSRRRCAGFHVPLRSFHFAFDSYHRWDKVAVDQWLSYVVGHGSRSSQELHLDLRFNICPICPYDCHSTMKLDEDSGSDDDKGLRDGWTYVLPRSLFSCTALRTLCVSYCRMKLPAAIDLPFLEKLRLTGVPDSGRSIQRLISSCPRLTDLALEDLRKLTRVSVLEVRLRSFALRCCHNVKTVTIDASELRSLGYSGDIPAESLLTLHGATLIPSCTIGLCNAPHKTEEPARCTEFLEKMSGAKHLRLPQGSLVSRLFAAESPLFASLTRLVLQGRIHSVDTVSRILEQTPNLEVLSLCFGTSYDQEEDDVYAELFVNESSFSIPCLRSRVKEMILEDYNGGPTQRDLVKFLLRNALVLERLYVAFLPKEEAVTMRFMTEEQANCHERRSRKRDKFQDELKKKIKRWSVPSSEKIFK